MGRKVSRPVAEDIERFLDQLGLEQMNSRRQLEDLANIEDGPETDLAIKRALKGIKENGDE